jgi:hypothetical protein
VHLEHAKQGHVLCSILPVKDVDVVALCVPSGKVIRVAGWCGAGERGVERYQQGPTHTFGVREASHFKFSLQQSYERRKVPI